MTDTAGTDEPVVDPPVDEGPSLELRARAAGMILGHTTLLSNSSQVIDALAAIDSLAQYLNSGKVPNRVESDS